MTRTLVALLLAILCASCATQKRNVTTTSIQVDSTSIGRKVLFAVPLDSAMERFEMVDREGRRFSYVAFTDTDYGGLLFLDNKLYGTVSKRDSRAFYSCRGFTSATRYYWARDASEWIDSLLVATTPADHVTLNFYGKTTMQRVNEAASNPMLSTVKSLVGMGTNPLSIFHTLNTSRSNLAEREKYEKTLQALNDLTPGDSESKLAKIVRPEDMSFTGNGIVMAYPSFLQDFFVNEGIVKVQQQPSFQRLSRLHAAIFYVRDMHWEQCNPKNWRQAMPPDWKPPALDEDINRSIKTDTAPEQ